MQNDKKSGGLPPAKRNGSKPPVDASAFDGRKQWLSRRDIETEYGLTSKTILRLEQAGKLVPSLIDAPDKYRKAPGTRKPRIKLYWREHLETLLHASFVSLRALEAETAQPRN
jgi:hypothetical protein